MNGRYLHFSLQNYIDHISQIDYSVGMYVCVCVYVCLKACMQLRYISRLTALSKPLLHCKRIREFMDISMSI